MRISKKRGSVLLLALLLVFLVITIGGLMTSTIILGQQYARDANNRLQAEYIFDATFRRAIRKYESDSEYRSDKWNIANPTAADPNSDASKKVDDWGTVDISVRPEVSLERQADVLRIEMRLKMNFTSRDQIWTEVRSFPLTQTNSIQSKP